MKLSYLDFETKGVILWATFMCKHPDQKTLNGLKRWVTRFHEKHKSEEDENLLNMIFAEIKEPRKEKR